MTEFDQKLDIFSPKTFLKGSSGSSTKKAADQIGSFNSRNHSSQNLKANKFQNFPQQFANFQAQSQERIQQFAKKVPENTIQFQQKVENFQNKQGQIISNKENIVNLSNQIKEKQQDSQQRNSILQKKPENKMKNSIIQQNTLPQKVDDTRSSSYFKKPFSQNQQPELIKNSQQINQKIENQPQNAMKESLLMDKFNSQFSNVNSPKLQNPMMFINKDKRPNSSKVDVVGCKEYFQSNYVRQTVVEQAHSRPSSSNQSVQKFDQNNQNNQQFQQKNDKNQQFQEKKTPMYQPQPQIQEPEPHQRPSSSVNKNDKMQFQEKKNPTYRAKELQFEEKKTPIVYQSQDKLLFQEKKISTYQSQIQEPARNDSQQRSSSTRSQVIEFGNKNSNLKVKQFFTNEELYGPNGTSNQSTQKTDIQTQKSSQIIQKKTRENLEDGEPIEQKDNKNFKQEYQEYQKLQDKLNYLETKINSIKTNINHNYQKESQVKTPEKFDMNLKFSQQLKSQQTSQMKNSLINNLTQQKKKEEEIKKPKETAPVQQEKASGGLQDFITQVKPQFEGVNNQNKQDVLQEKFPTTFLNGQKQPTKLKQSAFQTYQYDEVEEKENQKKQVQPQIIQINQSKQKSQSSQSLRNSSIISKTPNSQFIYYISSVISAYQNRQDNSYFAQLAREHFLQSMQAISFVKNLKPTIPKLIEEKKILLPKKNDNKKTLVFDLDETLIHCQESTNLPCDVILPIKFPTGELIEAGINIRPYCLPCLQELSKYYEIIVFTASHSCYANVVLDYLDPNQKYISARLYRENCIQTEEGVYIKDLRVLQGRNMSDIIIVDNASYSFGYQIENGLPILPYYDNKNDIELKNLISYLKSIHHVKDVREVNKKMLKINQFGDYMDPVLLIQSLFSDLL